jgi:hypothetical protein
MYPLNMHNPVAQGYAVANDEAEHQALTDAGYLPPLVQASMQAAASDPAAPASEPVKRGPGRPRKADA